MAASGGILKKDLSIKKKEKLPAKRVINLAEVSAPAKMNWKVAVPAIIVILVLATLIGKFGVADRYSKLSALESENTSIQSRIDDYYAVISENDVSEEYAHYTYSGMSESEKNRADRLEILKLVDKYVRPVANVDSLTIYENTLTMTCTGASLEQMRGVVLQMEQDEMVNFCQVNAAMTDADKLVNLQTTVMVFLNGPLDQMGGAGV